MHDRDKVLAVSAIGAYNLIQNLMLPASAYVPANLAATGGLIALARARGCTWDDLGLDPSRAGTGVRLGLAGAGLAGAVALAAVARPGARRYLLDERAAEQRSHHVIYRTMIRFPLGTALFEEVAFRGVLPAVWLRSGATKRQAAIAAAVAFGMWHIIPGIDALSGNPLDSRVMSTGSRAGVVTAGVVATGLASMGLNWMRESSRSLVAPWVTHATINGAVYLAGVAAWRRVTREGGTRPGSTTEGGTRR